MESLESLNRWQGAPVDGLNMPHGYRTHETADAIAEQTDGDGA